MIIFLFFNRKVDFPTLQISLYRLKKPEKDQFYSISPTKHLGLISGCFNQQNYRAEYSDLDSCLKHDETWC